MMALYNFLRTRFRRIINGTEYVVMTCRYDYPLQNLIWRCWRALLFTSPGNRFVSLTWCQYIGLLAEAGQKNRAARLIRKMMSMNPDENKLHCVARAALLAEEIGCTDAKISATAQAAKILFANHSSSYFSDLVRNKTIAVVGNGPCEIGKGLGREIDGHDLVIRFNNYDIEGHESDYGSRTDIWMKNNCETQKHGIRDSHIKVILYEAPLERVASDNGTFEAVAKDASNVFCDFFDIKEKSFFWDKFHLMPTSGAQLIERLRHLEVGRLDAYGFSFIETEMPKKILHVNGEDITAESSVAGHDFAVETRYLKSMFRPGRTLLPEFITNERK